MNSLQRQTWARKWLIWNSNEGAVFWSRPVASYENESDHDFVLEMEIKLAVRTAPWCGERHWMNEILKRLHISDFNALLQNPRDHERLVAWISCPVLRDEVRSIRRDLLRLPHRQYFGSPERLHTYSDSGVTCPWCLRRLLTQLAAHVHDLILFGDAAVGAMSDVATDRRVSMSAPDPDLDLDPPDSDGEESGA